MTNTNNNTIDRSLHLFARQGFGIGPYKLVGHNPECTVQNLAKARGQDLGLWPGPDQPAGTCDSCGQGIKDVYTLRSQDGTEFDVGCDCVEKAFKLSGCKVVDPALREIRRIKAAAAKKREAARVVELAARLNDDNALRALLSSMPHPKAWAAEQGQTLLDSIEWFFGHAGHAGKMKMVRMVAKIEGAK